MKKIVCWLSSDGLTVHTTADGFNNANNASIGITDIHRQAVTYLEEDSPKSDVTELVTLGMTAEDLIKLKHGGVI